MKYLKYSLLVLFSIIIVSVAVAMNWKNDIHPIATHKAYTIKKTWEMPKVLEEISGIAWLGDHTVASIQDEDGIIFIYDLSSNKIVQEIKFDDKGDYEGIAINNQDAYVMRSDGVIFEVLNFRDNDKKVSHFETRFSSKNNMESLFYDKNTESLITTPKHEGLESKSIKGLYRIAVASKKMDPKPFIKIDMNAAELEEFHKKKAHKTFNPSDIAIHPKTKDYYVLEGKKPKLMILDTEGNIKNIYKLDKDDFAQPEGLTFDEDGILYISNEANKGTANIMQVHLN